MARGNCCRLEVAAADFAEAELAYAEVVAEQEAARREREALIADFAKIQRPGASLASLLNGQPRELRELEGAVELRRRRIEAIRETIADLRSGIAQLDAMMLETPEP